MHFIASIIPLLALASADSHSPPYVRHRRALASHAALEAKNVRAQLAPRANVAHGEAHKVLKRTFNKRGEQCRPRSKISSSSAAAETSSTIVNQNAWAPSQTTTSTSIAPSSSSTSTSASASATTSSYSDSNNNSGNDNSGSGSSGGNNQGGDQGSGGGSGLLNYNDNSCGWCQSSPDSPNGAEWWLNCGINDSGWRPPHVGMNDLIASPLTGDGVFGPCAQYIDKFNQYAGEFGIHPVMLASFAMQESTCNAGAVGGNGEAGLMQISPPNCNNPSGSCWDVDYNIRRGAELFSQMIQNQGGNVLAAIGSYNGWSIGMTVGSATAAKSRGACFQQNNLDYIHQFVNGWMQGKDGHDLGTYFNLRGC